MPPVMKSATGSQANSSPDCNDRLKACDQEFTERAEWQNKAR